ncbi:uncharacterized protein HaLaN_06135 [Haematococcus lacustris]|uniref:Uncharacterized protein n=1 Tax=Haematococcus lacustris TaxID=44745 RepID=A0A699Z5P9_HAELA|nr:uncharacterized protein HaLaN_06135 [Haematococcus lacustris]
MPEPLAVVDAGVLTSWQADLQQALSLLQGQRVRELLMLATSPRYLERRALALARRAGQESKLLAAAAEAERRKHEAKAQLVALSHKASGH